jgi:hypothetical protein
MNASTKEMMKMHHSTRTLLVLTAAFTGLAIPAEAAEMPAAAIIQQWKGAYSAQNTAQRVVVKDRKSWEKTWSGMKRPMQPKTEAPKIDFDKHMVLAVFLGRKNTGGYAVAIAKIEQKEKLVVTVKETSPPPDAMVTMALTAPYHVVVVPKTEKAIEFVDAK